MKSFERQEIIQALQTILQVGQRISGIEYLRELARNIAKTLQCRYVLIGHGVKPANDRVQTDVVWAGNDFHDNFIYELKDTPCENVFSDSRVWCQSVPTARRSGMIRVIGSRLNHTSANIPMFLSAMPSARNMKWNTTRN